jgi:type IV pilus assembly protein PilP
MKNTSLVALGCIAAMLVAGCGGSEDDDLKAWMAEQGASARGKIQPIPPIRPYEAFTYNAFTLSDPFKPRKIESAKGALAPNLNRRKEALEAFPLETLSMVGSLQRGKALIGLVKAADNRVFQVRQGNYMGQNFGVITSITESDIALKELFQDGAGDWAERETKMLLQEREQKK